MPKIFKYNVGNMFVRTLNEYDSCNMLILCLSSDKQGGWEQEGPIWRCAEFQRSNDMTHLFGAQIVLYTEGELSSFIKLGNLQVEQTVK
jgi:hypothetical protein